MHRIVDKACPRFRSPAELRLCCLVTHTDVNNVSHCKHCKEEGLIFTLKLGHSAGSIESRFSVRHSIMGAGPSGLLISWKKGSEQERARRPGKDITLRTGLQLSPPAQHHTLRLLELLPSRHLESSLWIRHDTSCLNHTMDSPAGGQQ